MKKIKKNYKIIDTSLDEYYIKPYQFHQKQNYTLTYKTSDSDELANIINNLTTNVINNEIYNKKNLIKNNDFNPLVFKHIANNNINNLQNLLKADKNININQQDKDGDTPLHISIFLSNVKITKLLLENNADPVLIDKWGQTPLHRICFCLSNINTIEIIDLFIQKEKVENLDLFNIQDNNGNTVLHLILKHVIKNKTNINEGYKAIIIKLKNLTNHKLKNIDGQSITNLLNFLNLVNI
jgi:hypothetical protein